MSKEENGFKLSLEMSSREYNMSMLIIWLLIGVGYITDIYTTSKSDTVFLSGIIAFQYLLNYIVAHKEYQKDIEELNKIDEEKC